jgi:hypothetical protein
MEKVEIPEELERDHDDFDDDEEEFEDEEY